MYLIYNPGQLQKLKQKLVSNDFSCNISNLEFNVNVVDTNNSTLPYNEACEAINYLLGTSYEFKSVYRTDVFPCFYKDSGGFKQGKNSSFIAIVLKVSKSIGSPLVKVDL